jgi:hypothetical protein
LPTAPLRHVRSTEQCLADYFSNRKPKFHHQHTHPLRAFARDSWKSRIFKEIQYCPGCVVCLAIQMGMWPVLHFIFRFDSNTGLIQLIESPEIPPGYSFGPLELLGIAIIGKNTGK